MTAPAIPPAIPPAAGMPPNRVQAPGVPAVTLPASLVGFMTPQDVAAETQGVTPGAVALLEQEISQRQINDAKERQKALKAIYGDDFPLAKDPVTTPTTQTPHANSTTPSQDDNAWHRWVLNRWELHRPGIQQNIWMAERNRQFRAGFQWQSRINSMGAWRETPIPKDAVRIVDNKIRPALAWAAEVVAEQRPGWDFNPTNTDPDRQRKADAQQRAVEYQYNAQNKSAIDRQALYWAQTDGVAFQMTYWDPDEGPWEELESGRGPVPLGEPCTKVYRIEQVRVSAEATSTVKPMYWIVRDMLPMQQAVALYGPEVANDSEQGLLAMQMSQFTPTNQYAYQPLFQNQTTVARYTVFCEKSQWLPDGLTVIVVGSRMVYGPIGLLMGRVPMVRVTDGSEDPSFFPIPKMNLLIGPQMRINMLWSKWYESIRKNAGGRYASKSNAISTETFIGGETSILEIRAPGDIRESFMPVQSFSVGPDVKEALTLEIQTIEDLTGYTKQARGQSDSDESGRAILARQDTLLKIFAPQVTALAEANTEWAKQMIGWMKFGYQMPRKIAILGKDRSDLAMEVTSTDLDGVVDITVDRETLVPMPKSARQWLLDNAYDRKLITAQQWLDRSPFGDIRDMAAPSEAQYQKGKRVTESLRLRQPAEPVIPQDDPLTQMPILEHDLLLAGGIDSDVRQAAAQRWTQLQQLQQQKTGPQPPQPGTPEGQYHQFLTDIQQLAVKAAEKFIAQAVETEAMVGAVVPPNQQTPQGPPVMPPPQIAAVSQSRTPHAPHPALSRPASANHRPPAQLTHPIHPGSQNPSLVAPSPGTPPGSGQHPLPA